MQHAYRLHVAPSVATSIEKHLSIPGVDALLQDADDVHSAVSVNSGRRFERHFLAFSFFAQEMYF